VRTAGLDVGALWTKAVVLQDGDLVGHSVVRNGDDTGVAIEDALARALSKVGISADALDAVVATGAGRSSATSVAEPATDVVCLAKGALFFHPEARGVIDMGGESTRVVKVDADGNVVEFSRNDKCASGTGIFLDAMAKVMDVDVADMGPLSLESNADVNITSTCVAFAESEVVSQVHRQTPKMDILKGMHRSIATRVFGLVRRLDMDGTQMAVGGLALNVGVVACLEEMMSTKLLVPEHPQIVAAAGAALIAAEK
jgi:predicted CoA-substrate-specific enzyme activase